MLTIIGLENSGSGLFSRHCMGGRFVDYMRGEGNFSDWREDGMLLICEGEMSSSSGCAKLRLIKLNYNVLGFSHNDCGLAFLPLLLNLINPMRWIVVSDEVGLPIGEGAFLERVDPATRHMGVLSIISEMGTAQFAKANIGVGQMPHFNDDHDREVFFDHELSNLEIALVQGFFPGFLNNILLHSEKLVRFKFLIPDDVALSAHGVPRQRNAWVWPEPVSVSRDFVATMNRNVSVLIQVIAQAANKYSHLCETDPEHELVQLLETGLPERVIPFVRKSPFHLEHLSLDFQRGKIIEINDAPLVPVVPSLVRRNLSLKGPGVDFEPAMACSRVIRLVQKLRQREKTEPKVKILSRVGDNISGTGGWFSFVVEYLLSQGVQVSVGDRERGDRIVWVNEDWIQEGLNHHVIFDGETPSSLSIFPSPKNTMIQSKLILAILSSDVLRELIDVNSGQAKVLDQVVPFTRVVEGERDLIRYLLSLEHRLFYKPLFSAYGKGGSEITTKNQQSLSSAGIFQGWCSPWQISDLNMCDKALLTYHDLRLVLYGNTPKTWVWMARVWQGGEKLGRPMVAPVVFEN